MQTLRRFFLIVIAVQLGTDLCQAQMIYSGTPLQRVGSGFYEQNGVNWSLRGPQFFAGFGNGNLGVPFGGAAPGAGLRGGVGFAGNGLGGSLGFHFAQGSNRSISSTTPSITTLDGAPGSISSQTIRPFVTGINPVVGGYSYGNPTRENASAELFQSRQQSQAAYLQSRLNANLQAKQSKAAEAFQRGVRADTEGDLRKARANYRRALSLDQGPLRGQILSKLQQHGWN
ncbi:hypothetical protein NHH03_23035 [Stieleria sp. TO1_6]|uniref:hypothetical protein n=1 Tax=Stieleria tagensis TaxID=2956795 RepID=UPI00209BB0A4|nr:hypothetical protein [Stieleria tagensis]MCO8124632.1 hypothetical protein [Stieleria tagensis]